MRFAGTCIRMNEKKAAKAAFFIYASHIRTINAPDCY